MLAGRPLDDRRHGDHQRCGAQHLLGTEGEGVGVEVELVVADGDEDDGDDEPGDDSEPLEDLEPEAPVDELPARSHPYRPVTATAIDSGPFLSSVAIRWSGFSTWSPSTSWMSRA